MIDPLASNNPYKPWQSGDAKSRKAGQPLDEHLEIPDHIAERLANTRREAVQSLEQKQRRNNLKTMPSWSLGFGLAAAALTAIVVAPQLTTSEPSATPLPKALIVAEEDLEFFESLDLLEWSLENESTS